MRKQSVIFMFCAAFALILVTRPARYVWAQDDGQGEDCGSAIAGEDDDDQGAVGSTVTVVDDNQQGDDNGCGMVVSEVDDENGDQVEDVNDDGTPDTDVDVDVEVTTPDGVTQTLTFQTNGSFHLTGLPKGKARITVTRVHDGATTSRSRRVATRTHRTRTVHMRLRQLR